ncbi:MAG: YkgJ family cysteine cluster protein [Gemmatimonadales bacterium]|jgi:Fe-S-cluster containining protein|nr:MAG: YkgJ family cysteine cluster protein [Gemmatimonadales bacterium]
MAASLPVFYSCLKCPAYCCTYPQIPVEKRDIRRLAKRFGISEEKARKKFTKKGEERGTRVLRHREDAIFDSACMFLDPDSRGCTIYEHRPTPCREYPGTVRCGYYDFLASERTRQEDDDLVITAWVADL